MSARTYWLDLFTRETWQEFLDAGASVSGFREARWATVQRLQPGDYLLCYLVGLSRWVGILEVTSQAYKDTSPIWGTDVFPCRVGVRVVVKLTPETAVPIQQMRDQLSIFNHEHPIAWTGHLRGSPAKWQDHDGQAVVRRIQEVAANPNQPTAPITRPRKRIPSVATPELGPVTVPEGQPNEGNGMHPPKESPTLHTEVQWTLLKLGNDMGLDVWVAQNDKGRQFDGHKFDALPRLKSDLPHQFDEVTTRTIKLIDVLWLRGNAIVAAFEIECTTSIYSGLLRMSDLISMQPNLKIPLYLVAPDDRREKVIEEVNRPTFSKLKPPLNEVCRFLAIPALLSNAAGAERFIRHLRPEVIDDWAETCELEEV